MAHRYVKTAAGQEEIRKRTHGLTRSARTLLVLVDGQKDREELMSVVQGTDSGDFSTLMELGLIAEQPGAVRSSSNNSGFNPTTNFAASTTAETPPVRLPEKPASPLRAATTTLTFTELYESMTQLVRSQLGMIKGFKYTLEVEKASTVPELQVVARRFAVEVESVNGATAAAMVRRALNIED